MEKNKDKNKNREPFPPDHTPEPPQVMDTSRQPDSGTKENEQAKKKRTEDRAKDKNEKLLGESPTEIEDETTI